EELRKLSIVDTSPSWLLYLDGDLNSKGKGIGAVLLSLERVTIPLAHQLAFSATNNVAKYEALLSGLRLALMLKVKDLRIIGDSQLVLRQVLSKYRTRDPRLKLYRKLVKAVVKEFRKLTYVHTPRSQNILADSLASLASSLDIPLDQSDQTIVVRRMDFPSFHDPWFEHFLREQSAEQKRGEEEEGAEEELVALEEDLEPFDDGNPWYYDIENFCRDGSFPDYATADDRKTLRRIAQRYKIEGEILHRKAFSGLFLRCVPDDECMRIMEEAHSGECGGHFGGQTLAKKILKLC